MKLRKRCSTCKGFTCTQTDFIRGRRVETREYLALIHCLMCKRSWAVPREDEERTFSNQGAAMDEEMVGSQWLQANGFGYLTERIEGARVGG